MKKNISINISGIIFHIEEDGYEELRKYLDSVNRYFGAYEDSSEILSDIEGRIAEIFLTKLNDGKQVITAEDVQSLIATMGSVNDFRAAEEQEGATNTSAGPAPRTERSQAAPSQTKKLVRDRNRKTLGGVCAGLGHYFNIDPVWPRVIMALLALGTGVFIFVYIILWIVLPEEALEEQTSVKKMYRNPDKKVLGGVASGVAAFFNGDVALVRLFFVVGIFMGGLGLILYIILWVALPEARTLTEKMEMQGEPVTLSNIDSTVKKNQSDKAPEEESTLTRIILFPFRAIGAVLRFVSPVFVLALEIIRIGIGLLIATLGVVMIVSVFLGFGVVLGLFHAPDWAALSDYYISAPNFPIEAFRASFPLWMVLAAFFVAFIPSLLILLLGGSIVAKRIVFNSTVGWSMFVVFFLGVAILAFSLPQAVMAFREQGDYKLEQHFPTGNKSTTLALHEVGLESYRMTNIDFHGYEGTDIKVVTRFQAQGSSRKQAIENARMITYQVTQTDSTIHFDSNLAFNPDAKFRAQRVDVDVYLPYEKSFVIEPEIWRISDTDIINRHFNDNFDLNSEVHTWRMAQGGLQCSSCTPETEETASNLQDQYGLANFDGVDMKGIFDVRIEKGDAFAVELRGPEKEKKRYEVYVAGETLVIRYDDHRRNFWKRDLPDEKDVRVYITMPSLTELDVTGAGKVRIRGFDEQEMDVHFMGAIMGEGDFNCSELSVELTGASILDLSGKGRSLDAEVLGASGLRAFGFETEVATVEAHGASTAKVNVSQRLEISKGIASSVTHRGNPEVVTH